MRVIVACECSGAVRDAFIARGHDAISCDLKETEVPGPHYVGDARKFIANNLCDLLIAHPPCTYLAVSGSLELTRNPERIQKVNEAVEFFRYFLTVSIPLVCIENPLIMLKRTGLPICSQIIQPYYFGDPYTKRTCLWLKGLPPLMPTDIRIEARCYDERIPQRRKDGSIRYDNRIGKPHLVHLPSAWVGSRSDPTSRMHKLTATDRSRTFPGVAAAMADQWGNIKQRYGFF